MDTGRIDLGEELAKLARALAQQPISDEEVIRWLEAKEVESFPWGETMWTGFHAAERIWNGKVWIEGYVKTGEGLPIRQRLAMLTDAERRRALDAFRARIHGENPHGESPGGPVVMSPEAERFLQQFFGYALPILDAAGDDAVDEPTVDGLPPTRGHGVSPPRVGPRDREGEATGDGAVRPHVGNPMGDWEQRLEAGAAYAWESGHSRRMPPPIENFAMLYGLGEPDSWGDDSVGYDSVLDRYRRERA